MNEIKMERGELINLLRVLGKSAKFTLRKQEEAWVYVAEVVGFHLIEADEPYFKLLHPLETYYLHCE